MASTPVADCVVSEIWTGTSGPFPVRQGCSGVTVSTVAAGACWAPPVTGPEPEPPGGAGGPMAVITPGVTAPEGKTMWTRSRSVTRGALPGSSGTVTTRVAVVTW